MRVLPAPSWLIHSVRVGTWVTMKSLGRFGSIGTQILPIWQKHVKSVKTHLFWDEHTMGT